MAFGKKETVVITPPRFRTAEFKLIGISPLVVHRFSEKAKVKIAETAAAGDTAKSKKKKDAVDFDQNYLNAFHVSTEGWYGFPASAFRNAMIEACKIVNYVMTRAKLAIFVEAEGIDEVEGIGLVQIEGKPEKMSMAVRNQNTGGSSICVRPMWRKWGMSLKVRFDEDMMTLSDITNLLARAGEQVGVGEGRPASRKSCGMGWGTFRIEREKDGKND